MDKIEKKIGLGPHSEQYGKPGSEMQTKKMKWQQILDPKIVLIFFIYII